MQQSAKLRRRVQFNRCFCTYAKFSPPAPFDLMNLLGGSRKTLNRLVYMKIKLFGPRVYWGFFKHIPRASVDVIVLNKKGEVLLTKRDIPPGKGKWHIPGGGVAKGERAIQTAVRKIKDETGLKIKVRRLVGVWDDPKRNPMCHDFTCVFLASVVGGKLKGSWQASDVKFFNPKKLPKMMFDHNKEIEYALKGKIFMWGLK